MNRFKRLSLFYLIGYLVGGGVMLLAAPALALLMLGTRLDYGPVMPRVVGALMVALGCIVTQVLRLGIHNLYATLVVVRLGLCTTWLVMFIAFHDALFLSLLAVVGTGVVLTVAGMVADCRARSAAA